MSDDLPTIRWVRKLDPELDLHWRYLYRLTNDVAKRWVKSVEQYRKDLQQDVSPADIIRAVESGEAGIVADRMGWDAANAAFKAATTPIIVEALQRSGNAEVNRLKLAMRFDLDNPFAFQWIDTRTAALVTQVADETKAAIRGVIREAFLNGDPPRKSAQTIRTLVGLTERDSKAVLRYWRTVAMDGNRSAKVADDMADTYARKLLRRRAENIARTETINAANAGVRFSWQEAKGQGLTLPGSMMEWIAALDSKRTCQRCIAMDSQKVPIGQPFMSDIGPIDGPTLHPSCLVPDTEVVAPNLVAGSERWFEGTIITLVTANGDELSVTPNHPILTPHGWVAAGLLKEGGNLVRSSLPVELARLLDPDHQHVPTRVKEITDALKMAPGMITSRVPVTNEDFHGDGIEGDVDVVFPNGCLGTNADPTGEGGPEINLVMRSVRQLGIHGNGEGVADRFVKGTLAPQCGSVSCFGNRHAFLFGHAGHTDEHVLPVVSMLQTIQPQNGIDEASGSAECIAESNHSFPAPEAVDNRLDVCLGELPEELLVTSSPGLAGSGADLFKGHPLTRKGNTCLPIAEGNSAGREQISEDAFSGVRLFGQLVERFPGLVAATQIISIKRSLRSTHVYNLQTEQEWYIASNIITHNCRCAIALVTEIPK